MSNLLKGHNGTVVVIDDILVFGHDKASYDKNLEEVLQTIQESGLRLNKEKCCFSKSELRYFGHIINKDGVRPNPDKMKAITEMASPTDITQLRQVLGMID
ncbi:hypothetical protein LDENG_00121830 [Lucifuga dentata]|nr:hypothetical protein LDENG_00121830 [Lucifuga dentata]